jgi:hypothetical protein
MNGRIQPISISDRLQRGWVRALKAGNCLGSVTRHCLGSGKYHE